MKKQNILMVAMLSLGTIGLQAQGAPEKLKEVVVTDVPIEESILPTARPVQGLFGTEKSILETPRSVTMITKAQVEERGVQKITDLGQFSAGVYSPSVFGLAGVPTIRGQFAEIYQNGQRNKFYRNSLPVSFNQVDDIEIVKGAGTAVLGPASRGVGGLVNLKTKQPYFDRQHTEISYTLGSYVPGGQSYAYNEWSVDNSGPLIKDKLAYRVSYLGREAESYYRNLENNTQDIFLALSAKPYENVSLDWTGQYFASKFHENVGFNRPTQELIDHRTYTAGSTVTGTGFGPGFQAFAPTGNDTFFVQTIDPTSPTYRKTKVYGYETLSASSDSSRGSRGVTQLKATVDIDDGFKVVNTTLGETVETRKISAYGYDEYSPYNVTFDNRTEIHLSFDTPIGSTGGGESMKDPKDSKSLAAVTSKEKPFTLGHSLVTGMSFRYEGSENYQDYNNEPFTIYDVKNPASIRYNYVASGPIVVNGVSYNTFGGFPIPARPQYSAGAFFGSQAVESNLFQWGTFIQDDIKITDKFSVLLGARGDYFAVDSARPSLIGFPGSRENGQGASTEKFNYAVFGTATYKVEDWFIPYLAYNRVSAVQGSGNFGAIGYETPGGNIDTPVTTLQDLTELYETGFKGTLLNDTLYYSLAGFYQTRIARDRNSAAAEVETRGVEFETTYQPNRNLSLNFNATWQEANYNNNGFIYSQTGNYLDAFPAGYVVDGKVGTGVGGPNYSSAGSGDQRLVGQPKILLNAYATYKFTDGILKGFGVGLGPSVTSDQNVNTQATLVIPWQQTWNAQVFYVQPHWEAKINVFNFTDERNWNTIEEFAQNDLIYPQEPLTVRATVKLKF